VANKFDAGLTAHSGVFATGRTPKNIKNINATQGLLYHLHYRDRHSKKKKNVYISSNKFLLFFIYKLFFTKHL